MKRLSKQVLSFVLVFVMVVGMLLGHLGMKAQAAEGQRPEATGILGDANGDGKLSCSDWVRVQAELEGSEKLASKDVLFSNGRIVEETDAEIVWQLLMHGTSAIPEETVLAYGTTFGQEQMTPKWNDGRAYAEYTTEKAYGEENGSLKITQLVQSESGYGQEVMFQFKKALHAQKSGYDDNSFLKFYVWYEGTKAVENMTVMLTHVTGEQFGWGDDILENTAVKLTQNQWTEVCLPLKDVNSLNEYGVVMFADWQNFEGDTFYFSNATVVEIDNRGIVYGFGNGTSMMNNPENYAVSVEYTTDMAYGTEQGSLKLTNDGNYSETLLALPKQLTTLTGTEVLELYIYYAPAEDNTLGNMNIYLTEDMWDEGNKVSLTKNEWTKVSIDLSKFKTNNLEGLYVKLMSSDWGGCIGDVWYLSSVRTEMVDEGIVYALSHSTEGTKSFVNAGQVSYSTDVKYGKETGSTKLYYADAGKDIKPYLTNEKHTLTGTETVEFYVYYSGTDVKHLNVYGLRNGRTVFLSYVDKVNKDGWTKVSFYLQGCTSINYLLIQNDSWTTTSAAGDTFYISDVKVVEQNSVVYDYGTGNSSLNTCGYASNVEFSMQKAYAGEDGSLKITNKGNSSETLLAFQDQLSELSGTEIVEMYVYYKPAEGNNLGNMYFYLSNGAYDKDATPVLMETKLNKEAWTKVTIDLTQISKTSLDGLYIKLMSSNWGGCVGDEWYFSSMKVTEHCQYTLETGLWSAALQEGGGQHPQGMAYDDDNKYVYVSYTRLIAKVDVQTGEVVGCVKGFSESSVMKDIHLGDMTYYDGKIYEACKVNNRFYIAVFDCDKINGEVHYQDEGVMKALYLSQLTENTTTKMYDGADTSIPGAGTRYWWTGSDGITVGKLPGGGYDTDGDGKVDVKDDKMYIFHTNGGYKNPSVYDNENYFMQVFDLADINESNLLPFTDARVNAAVTKTEEYHYKFKTFVYVGNSDYGVQTLTYDKDTGDFWMETYGKPAGTEFPKYGRYVIDGSVPLYMAEVEVGQSVTGDAEGFISQAEAHRIAALYKDFEDGDGDGNCDEQEQGWHMTLKCLCEKGGLENHESVVYGATGHACKICGAQASFYCGMAYAGNGYFYGATNYIKEGIGGVDHHGAAVNLYKWNDSKKKLEMMYYLFPIEE